MASKLKVPSAWKLILIHLANVHITQNPHAETECADAIDIRQYVRFILVYPDRWHIRPIMNVGRSAQLQMACAWEKLVRTTLSMMYPCCSSEPSAQWC